MIKKIGLAAAAVVALIVLSHSVPVVAQPREDSSGMMGGRMHGGMMMGRDGMQCPMMAMTRHGKPRTEGRLAFLKAELNITAEQENAWEGYANTVRDIHKAMAGKKGRMRAGRMQKQGERKSAPEMLQAHISMMENMLEPLKELHAATADLYKLLDDSQKATADELLGMPCGMM